jgi:hypothetical protein
MKKPIPPSVDSPVSTAIVPAKPSLYDISERYRAVLEMAQDDDIPPEVIADTLEAIEGEFKDKALAVAGYFQGLDAQVEAMKEAEKRIFSRRKLAEAHAQRLRDYVFGKMVETGIQKIECPYFALSLVKNPPSVEVYDEKLVPPQFIRTEVVRSIDKAAIKAAGGCPGARLVSDAKRLKVS